jgi:hypothetical protein
MVLQGVSNAALGILCIVCGGIRARLLNIFTNPIIDNFKYSIEKVILNGKQIARIIEQEPSANAAL